MEDRVIGPPSGGQQRASRNKKYAPRRPAAERSSARTGSGRESDHVADGGEPVERPWWPNRCYRLADGFPSHSWTLRSQPETTPCGQPIPVSEAHALGELARAGTLGQLELGQRLNLQKSTVSRLVAQLLARGWVQREADQNDGRASLLRLTASGRQAATQLAEARTQKFTQLLERIPAEHRGQVLHALDILTEALRDPRP